MVYLEPVYLLQSLVGDRHVNLNFRSAIRAEEVSRVDVTQYCIIRVKYPENIVYTQLLKLLIQHHIIFK